MAPYACVNPLLRRGGGVDRVRRRVRVGNEAEMTVTLHMGDCLEYMRTMPAGSVDCVVTDPPYGIGKRWMNPDIIRSRGRCANVIYYGEFNWDEQPATQEQINELLRVSKNQVVFGGNYFVLPPSRSWVVWDKMNSGDFSDCELIWTSHDKGARIFHYMWNGMIKQKPEKRFHPAQKPLALMLWVIENYTLPGNTIFDPFMGSGTTGVACVQLGRSFIGCEISPEYFNIAKRRIEQAQLQMLLPLEYAPTPLPDETPPLAAGDFHGDSTEDAR